MNMKRMMILLIGLAFLLMGTGSAAAGQDAGPMQILAYTKYADVPQEYANTLQAIQAHFTNFVLTETATTSPSELQSLLQGKHVFLVPEQEMADYSTLYSLGVSWAPVLQPFVAGGGGVLVMDHNGGIDATYGIMTGAGLMSLTPSGEFCIDHGGYGHVVVPSHPTVAGVPETFLLSCGSTDFSVYDGTKIVEHYQCGNSILTVKEYGSGRLAMLGMDFFSYDDNGARLLSNTVQWVPEPAVMSTLALGGLAMLRPRRRKARATGRRAAQADSSRRSGSACSKAIRPVSLAVALAVCLGPAMVGHAAVPVVSLVGDKDGFGVGCPIQSGLHYLDYGAYWADYREPDDPPFTDYWYTGDKSWVHTYDLAGMTPTSASLQLFLAGIANQDSWTADVRVNGVTVATIPTLLNGHDVTRLLDINVPVGLLTSPTPTSINVSYSGDGYIVDYSELTIVPEPATLSVLCAGGLAVLRRGTTQRRGTVGSPEVRRKVRWAC